MFIAIETFDKVFPYIACDEEGMPLVFETYEEAEAEAEDLQLGIVVEI